MSEYFRRPPKLVNPIEIEQPGGGKGINVVVIERVEPGREPKYKVRGKSTCWWCTEWCWLGTESYELVRSGQAAGMCRQCCAELIPKGMKPSGHVDDERA